MLSKPKTDTSNYTTNKGVMMDHRSEPQILRTVHIAAVKEPADELSLDVERGPVGLWDGKNKHRGQRTNIYS